MNKVSCLVVFHDTCEKGFYQQQKNTLNLCNKYIIYVYIYIYIYIYTYGLDYYMDYKQSLKVHIF